MEERSFFEKQRRLKKVQVPQILKSLNNVMWISTSLQENGNVKEALPCTYRGSHYEMKAQKAKNRPLKIGVVFSGGPAPGGHNVLAGLLDACLEMGSSRSLIGFLNGPNGIMQNQKKELFKEDIDQVRNLGGFELLGTGRDKIETAEQLAQAAHACRDLDGLVVIGGDDSNTNAAFLAEYFLQNKIKTRVIGVPKTIDGDLRAEGLPIPFGFDTACTVYASLIGNLAKDALSVRKYYHFIKLMGRSASHIVLECALLCQPNIALIGEEKLSLQQIVEMLTSCIEERFLQGKSYGIFLIPEGLLEFIPEMHACLDALGACKDPNQLQQKDRMVWDQLPSKIQEQLLLTRDPHGNLRLSQTDTQELLIQMVEKKLQTRGFQGPFHPVGHFFGYEGRCSAPSSFDAAYTYALGRLAALCVRDELTGVLCAIPNLHAPVLSWQARAIPLSSLLQFEERDGVKKLVIGKSIVGLDGAPYQRFLSHRARWRTEDAYRFTAPLPFEEEAPEVFFPQSLVD